MAFQNQAPSLTNVAGTNNLTVLNATVPEEGAKCVPIVVDLTSAASADVDLTLMTAQQKMSGVQAIYLDNSLNSEAVTITCNGANQIVKCPAGSQGTYPIIATNKPKFTVATGGAVSLLIHFLNVPLPANVWFPATGEPSQGQGAAINEVTTGGTPVNVWNPPPNGGGVIINPLDAAESLFVDIVNAADSTAPGANGTTVELPAGQSFIIPPNFGGVVSVNAATDGHVFTAYGATL